MTSAQPATALGWELIGVGVVSGTALLIRLLVPPRISAAGIPGAAWRAHL